MGRGRAARVSDPGAWGAGGGHVSKEPAGKHEELARERAGRERMRTACTCLASLECVYGGPISPVDTQVKIRHRQPLTSGSSGSTEVDRPASRGRIQCWKLSGVDISATDFRAVPQGHGKRWRTVASPGQAGVRPRKQRAQSE